ncbi:lysophospholipid acyltransferase family protein [Spiroplasma endosymbiont of Nephrotoma flavescens]|uniref:lysophospholipid acyltransferase family protein n=1 Tax=Spiroplasma endosymbiont of Nephrotoma flavescens TaxID=3066302 RepID=UPI00313BCA03
MNKWRVIITLPYLLQTLRKAKKMTKKVLRDPNSVSEEYRYKWLQKRARYFAWLYNVKVYPQGLENWVNNKGCVMIANHQSNFDALLLLLINDFSKFAPLAFIAKQELQEHKIFKRFVQLIDVLFLDRNNPRHALEVFSDAKMLIRVPRTMVIFPEGTRSNSSTVQEFKPAALRIAYQAYVPIIPVAIINSYEVFNKKSQGKKKIYLVIQKPLDPANFINITTDNLARNMQSNIQKIINNFNLKNKDEKK